MTKLLWTALPSLLLLAGCNSASAPMADANQTATNDQTTNMADPAMMAPANASAAAPVTETPTYLARAGAGDLFEIESSRAILAKTANADIKNFAQMMIEQHGQSTAKIKAAAEEAKMTVPPPSLEPVQQQMLDGIKSASGAAADQAYIAAQRTAHDQALALHRGYAAGGDTPQLKTAAGEIASVVQHHIEELAKLDSQ